MSNPQIYCLPSDLRTRAVHEENHRPERRPTARTMGACSSAPKTPRNRTTSIQKEANGPTRSQLLRQSPGSIFCLSFDDQNAVYLGHTECCDRIPLGVDLAGLLSLHSCPPHGASLRSVCAFAATNKMFSATVPSLFTWINTVSCVPPIPPKYQRLPRYHDTTLKLVLVGDGTVRMLCGAANWFAHRLTKSVPD
jgi:hypothetical protein